jgi:trehalose 6-phosphate phosphatase
VSDAGVELLVHRVLEVLGTGHGAGLVTDVDGTISPIVGRPEDARVLPRARAALEGLTDILALVAVVSGRRATDARTLVGLDRLVYVGNHGFERVDPSGALQVALEALPWVGRVAALVEDLQRQVTAPHAGVVIEDKGATASLHYRLAPEPERVRHELLAMLSRSSLAHGLRIEEGRMVLNVLPPVPINKGSAVSWLVHEYHLRRVVYFGDDVTDTHAFTALRAFRDTQQVHTLSIGVVGPETPPSVGQLADATVPSAETVADLLDQVLGRLAQQ